MRTDLYTLVAPASDAILSVKSPCRFHQIYLIPRLGTGCFRLEDSGYLPFHHPKQPEYPVVTSIFPSTGSYPLCTSGKQPRRPDREKHIAKGFRLVRSAETKKGRHHFTYYPGYRKPFFRLIINTRAYGWQVTARNYSKKSAQIQRNRQRLPATPGTKTACASHSTKTAPLHLMYNRTVSTSMFHSPIQPNGVSEKVG